MTTRSRYLRLRFRRHVAENYETWKELRSLPRYRFLRRRSLARRFGL